MNSQKMTSHLIELRKRLLNCLYMLAAIFVVLFYFSNPLFELVATPLIKQLPHANQLIATAVTGTLVAPLKLSFFCALFLAMPFCAHQLWRFFAPGLYQCERFLIWPLLLVSTLLFYAGIAFAYFVVFPLLFTFFINIAPQYITVMPDIDSYVGFCLKLFFAFGLAFQVPILTLLCYWSGLLSLTTISKKRPYVLVAAFTLGMVLTPPDVLSQILLAIPLYLLFELGIIIAKVLPSPGQTIENTE